MTFQIKFKAFKVGKHPRFEGMPVFHFFPRTKSINKTKQRKDGLKDIYVSKTQKNYSNTDILNLFLKTGRIVNSR